MDATEAIADRISLRRQELDNRIVELHHRNDLLSAVMGRAGGPGNGHNGSSRTQVTRAGELARRASERAGEATRRAVLMHRKAATAHVRAARMHDLLAGASAGDEQEHAVRAAEHRRLAMADQAAAETLDGQPG
jgi:hypothetical protein